MRRYIIAHFLIFIKQDRFVTYICSNYTFIYIPHCSDEVNAFANHNWLWTFFTFTILFNVDVEWWQEKCNRSKIRFFISLANAASELVLNLFWSKCVSWKHADMGQVFVAGLQGKITKKKRKKSSRSLLFLQMLPYLMLSKYLKLNKSLSS